MRPKPFSIEISSVYFSYEPASHYLFASLSEEVCEAWVNHFSIPTNPTSTTLRQRVSLCEARKLHPELSDSGFEWFVLSMVDPSLLTESLSESDAEVQRLYACTNE